MNWSKEILINGFEAVTPEIISASRATDIPAFYSKWFFNRLKAGFVEWKNPFNNKFQYVSFSKTRLVVFWTKNPQPILPYLNLLDKKGINYYFQFTLNNYESENYEQNLPLLKKRIEVFRELSEMIGKDKVVWRFDPIFTTKEITSNEVLYRIIELAKSLHKYTNRLVFSFADIDKYKKVKRNLTTKNIEYQILNLDERKALVKALSEECKKTNLELRACAQEDDYQEFDVLPNKCIDDELILKNFKHDELLMKFLYGSNFKETLFPTLLKRMKDNGQRKHCKCIKSKDIGMYNTCPNLCAYCYANSHDLFVVKNFEAHNCNSPSLIQT